MDYGGTVSVFDFVDEKDHVAVQTSLETMFVVRPWQLYEIRAMRNKSGDVLGYWAIDNGFSTSFRSDLPTEFFNHGLKDFDSSDPSGVMEFMGEYGFLGTVIGSTPPLLKDKLATGDVAAIDLFERIYNFSWCSEISEDDNDNLSKEDYVSISAELRTLVDEVRKNRSRGNYRFEVVGAMSVLSARRQIEEWQECANVIKGCVTASTVEDLRSLAESLGDRGEDRMRNALDRLNQGLMAYSPEVSVSGASGQGILLPGRGIHPEASLNSAIALQLWKFILGAKEGLSICKECGQPFVEKYSPKTRGCSRKSSEFCCDRCKNRYSQRRYRESPGYKLKHGKKAQSN